MRVEKPSIEIESLIDATEQGHHLFGGMMHKDRLVGYLKSILFRTRQYEHEYLVAEMKHAEELTRLEELVAKGLRAEQQHPTCETCGCFRPATEHSDNRCGWKQCDTEPQWYCNFHTSL